MPQRLVEAFCGARTLLDRHPPSADQHVLAAFIAEGHLDRHIRRIRGVYGECRSQLSQILQDVLPSDLAWLQPSDQGMHSVLWLAPGIDDQAISNQAARAGVAVRPVSCMYAEGSGRSGLILGLVLQIDGLTGRGLSSRASYDRPPVRRRQASAPTIARW